MGNWNWLLTVVGAGFTIRALYLIARGLQSRRWPTTTGKFLDIGSVGGDEEPVELRLKYGYTVAGRNFVSFRVSYGRPILLETFVAPGLQARNELGDLRQLTVYYDPGNPERAVLRPGIELYLLLELLVGLGLIWFSAWLGASRPMLPN